jgi:P-type Cu+ transporter
MNCIAQAIASQLGISNVLAQVQPHEKAEKIAELQKQHEIVAMVGDGINDAIALAKADISIAIGAGTDIAVETSNIILMKSDLRDLITCFNLSRRSFLHICWNFFWAIIYNVISIPLAAGVIFPFTGWVFPPAAAAALELCSSIPVVLFALLLRFYKAPAW